MDELLKDFLAETAEQIESVGTQLDGTNNRDFCWREDDAA